MKTLYLNNTGSRWVVLDNQNKKEKRSFEVSDRTTVERTVLEYESFGNFATCKISWKGKKIKVFADTILEA